MNINLEEIRERLEEMKQEMRGNKADKGTEEHSTKEECRKAIERIKPLVEIVKKVVKLKLNGFDIPLDEEDIADFEHHANLLMRFGGIGTKFTGSYAKKICNHLRQLKALEEQPMDELIEEEIKTHLYWIVQHAEWLKKSIPHAEIHEISDYKGGMTDEQA